MCGWTGAWAVSFSEFVYWSRAFVRERSDIFSSSFEAESILQCFIKIVFLCQEFLLNLFTLKSTDESIAQGLAEVSTKLTCGHQMF